MTQQFAVESGRINLEHRTCIGQINGSARMSLHGKLGSEELAHGADSGSPMVDAAGAR